MCRTWAPSSLWSSCQFSQSPLLPLASQTLSGMVLSPKLSTPAQDTPWKEKERKDEEWDRDKERKWEKSERERERERFHSPGLAWAFLTRVEPHSAHTCARRSIALLFTGSVCCVWRGQDWHGPDGGLMRCQGKSIKRNPPNHVAWEVRAGGWQQQGCSWWRQLSFYCGKYCDFVFFSFYCDHQAAGQEHRPLAQMALRNAFPAISAETR